MRHAPAPGIAALLAAALAAAAGFVAVTGVQPTRAAWTSAHAVSVTATAVTPAAVPGLACGAGSGTILTSPNIPISWSAPAGPTPSRYRIAWAGSAGSNTMYSTTTSASINAAAISVAGTSTVSVYAEYGDWVVAPPPVQTISFTTIAVLVVVSWTCQPVP